MGDRGKLLMGRYEVERWLGQGNFAMVYQAIDIRTDQKVAIKVIKKENISSRMTELIKREISVMKLVKHPNIVQFYEVMANKNKIFIVMEFVTGGEMYSRLSRGMLREHIARKFFRQLISAVNHCHKRGVYHRDLKLENILLDDNGNIKVADFGLSALSENKHKDGMLYTACGTPDYLSPEVVLRKGYDGAKADIWSCGVILFAMLAGRLPFNESNMVMLYKKICRAEYRFPRSFSPDVRQLLSKILDPNPVTRFSVLQITQNPWFMMGLNSPVETLALQDVDTFQRPCGSISVANQATGKEFQPTIWNAFDIIAHSVRLNLASLFVKDNSKEEACFTSNCPISSVISKLEETARTLNLTIMKKDQGLLRLQGLQEDRLEGLTIDAEIFELTPSHYVVEIKKSDGSTLEFKKIVDDLRLALSEYLWIWQGL